MTIRLLPALLLTACAPSLTTVPAGPEFELSPGGTVQLEETGAVLTMLEVANDSRCPIDVVCVTAGSAEVRFRVRREGSETTVSLHTMQEPREVTVGAIPPAAYRARIRWSSP